MGAAERLVPYRARAPAAAAAALEALARGPRLFLVQRPGPTSFVVEEEEWGPGEGAEGAEPPAPASPAGSGAGSPEGAGPCAGGGRRGRKTFRVLIGSRVSCTCQRRAAEPEVCVHTLFVLTRVLRVPPSNPIVWQLSLIDRELEEVMKCSLAAGKGGGRGGRAAAAAPGSSGARPRGAAGAGAGDGVRHKPEDDGPCPICYEEMAGELPQRLVFCAGCGHNVHGRCLHVWANHQASIGKDLSCPMCRRSWEGFKWNPAFAADPRARAGRRAPVESAADAAARRENTHYGTSCGSCRVSPLQGARYRCAICEHFDLCSACFEKGVHDLHLFTVQEAPGAAEVPAERAAPQKGAADPRAAAGGGGGGGGGAAPPGEEAAVAASRRAAKRIEEGRRKAGCAGPSSGPGGGDRWGGAAARASKSRGGAALRDAGGLENDLGLLAVGTALSQGPLAPANPRPGAPKPRRGGSAGGGRRRARAGSAAGGHAAGAPARRGHPADPAPALSLPPGGCLGSAR